MRAIHPALLLLTTFVTVYLQCRIEWVRNILGVQLDLLPPIMVYAALSTNFGTVTLLAFTGGLFYDAMHAEVARREGCAVIRTLNVSHFRHVAPDLEVVPL